MYKEKTNEELINEILEESAGGLKKENLDTKNTIKKDSHYQLPLTLINSYTWANLSKPAKALLPVIGCFQNKHTRACYLARETMAKYTGYNKFNIGQTIDKALKELVSESLIIKGKGWPCKNYYLTDKAKCEERKSYFLLYRYQVERGYWAKLKPCEKALYPVLYVKGTINYSEIKDDPEICCRGEIKNIKKFIDWAGISRPSFKSAINGFYMKSLIGVDYDETYDLYRLDRLYEKKTIEKNQYTISENNRKKSIYHIEKNQYTN